MKQTFIEGPLEVAGQLSVTDGLHVAGQIAGTLIRPPAGTVTVNGDLDVNGTLTIRDGIKLGGGFFKSVVVKTYDSNNLPPSCTATEDMFLILEFGGPNSQAKETYFSAGVSITYN